MDKLIIRELNLADENNFLEAMQLSRELHSFWVSPPLTRLEFIDYYYHYQQNHQKSFLLCNSSNLILGVFNLNEIVRGVFQNAYLGFYAIAPYAGKGYMSAGMKLLFNKAFLDLKLHRLEANIQPNNHKSINLVKSNGFRKEGFSPNYLKINNQWRDHERWAITAEDILSISKPG